MFKALLILTLSFSTEAAIAYDGNQQPDCFSKARYTTIDACNNAIKRNKSDVHAWVDRAIIKAQLGDEQSAASDLDHAARILNQH